MSSREQDIGFEEKVAFLSRPEAYPEMPARVEQVETHMSRVFLTDLFAYKLKKPVRYTFLDFRTCEARRKDCEAELRLNRRLAGDVYLEMVPLVLTQQSELRLNGAGQVVDWLVKMRRLPVERTLKYAIEYQVVDMKQVRDVAEKLAHFYAAADPEPMDPDAYVKRQRQYVLENQNALISPNYELSAGQIETSIETQLGFLNRRSDVLYKRASEGRLLDAHGDLRPEHIYLGPQPVIVDCLEFNREFRLLDPVDELSFLAMECDFLGNEKVGPEFFTVYRRVAKDEVPQELIPFYKCYRASLRAKLAVWHLDEPDVADPSKWTKRGQRYLALASKYAEALDKLL